MRSLKRVQDKLSSKAARNVGLFPLIPMAVRGGWSLERGGEAQAGGPDAHSCLRLRFETRH